MCQITICLIYRCWHLSSRFLLTRCPFAIQHEIRHCNRPCRPPNLTGEFSLDECPLCTYNRSTGLSTSPPYPFPTTPPSPSPPLPHLTLPTPSPTSTLSPPTYGPLLSFFLHSTPILTTLEAHPTLARYMAPEWRMHILRAVGATQALQTHIMLDWYPSAEDEGTNLVK